MDFVQTSDDRSNKFLTILCVLLPLLRYRVPGIDVLLFSDLAIIFSFIVFVSKSRGRIYCFSYSKALLVFLSYAIVITVLNVFQDYSNISAGVNLLLRQSLQLLYVSFVIPVFFNKEFGIRAGILIGVLTSLLIIVQFSLYSFAGIKTAFIIPFLMADGGYSNSILLSATNFRCASVFFEPSDYAYYILPILFLNLFFGRKMYSKRQWVLNTIILTLGCICSRSTTAILYTLVIYVLFFILFLKREKLKKQDVIGIALIVVLGIIFINSDIFQSSIAKASNINNGSTATRIFRGFIAFGQSSVFAKLFGVGFGNYASYLNFSEIVTSYDYIQNISVTNSFSELLLETGILGFVLYTLFYYTVYKRTKNESRYLLLLLFSLGMCSGVLHNVTMCMYFGFILCGHGTNSTNKEVKNELAYFGG